MFRIYNPSTFELLYVYSKVLNATWVKKFYEPGSFTITISNTQSGTEYIKKDMLLVDGDNCGIIKYRKKSKNSIEIRGSDLKGWCSQRLIIPPFCYMEEPTVESGYDRVSGSEEDVIRHYAAMHLVAPTDTARKIPNLELAAKHGYGSELVWQAKFTNLSEELASICLYSQLGYDIKADIANKKYVFDVIQGCDRTRSDSSFGSAVFNEAYKNISNAEYTDDATNELNVAYALGDGEEEQQFVYEAYKGEQPSGFSRKEGSLTVSGTDAEYADEAESKALSYISDNAEKESIDADANNKLEYKKDWNLGDFVTVMLENCFGDKMTLNKQITEVTEKYDRNNINITPVFGEKKQSIIKRITRS